MNTPETMTPKQAAEQSAHNYNQHRLAVAAVEKAEEVIERSATNAADVNLDDHRRALAAWHVQSWNERELPRRTQDLDTTAQKAKRDYARNKDLYHTAAIAFATLDSVEIR